MPKQEEMLKNYKVHIDLLTKLIKQITDKRIQKVIKLEQQIISGMNGKSKAKSNDMIKQISQISKQLHDDDYLRILMIYFACYDLSKKDKETMLKSI